MPGDCHTFTRHAVYVAVENKRRRLLTSKSVRERQIHVTAHASVLPVPHVGVVAETAHA